MWENFPNKRSSIEREQRIDVQHYMFVDYREFGMVLMGEQEKQKPNEQVMQNLVC